MQHVQAAKHASELHKACFFPSESLDVDLKQECCIDRPHRTVLYGLYSIQFACKLVTTDTSDRERECLNVAHQYQRYLSISQALRVVSHADALPLYDASKAKDVPGGTEMWFPHSDCSIFQLNLHDVALRKSTNMVQQFETDEVRAVRKLHMHT